MRVRILKRAITGVLTLVLSLSGITVFADTTSQQPPAGGSAPPSIASLLTQYVTSGVLTQAELDGITAFVAAQDAARKTEMDAMQNLTETERQAQMTGEKKAPTSFKEQFLSNSLITEAQAAAIDWTTIERPAHNGSDGQTPPTGTASGTPPTAANTAGTQSSSTAAGITVMFNGAAVNSTVKPFADNNGRTLIELRSAAEALGAEIAWDSATQTVTLTSATQTVAIKINQSAYQVNGMEKTMDTAAIISDGHTMVPVRVIAEALGATVSYDNATKVVTITQ